MKKFDSAKLLKVHDRMSRTIPLASKRWECEQETLIRRCFHGLNRKSFKLCVDGEIHYALFIKSTITSTRLDDGTTYKRYSYGVDKCMNLSSNLEIELSFFNEKAKRKSLNITSKTEFLYEEITIEEYNNIVKLFTPTA